jgi:hypothetical protein
VNTHSGQILPCPFCGKMPWWVMADSPKDPAYLACVNDDCLGPRTLKSDAIAQWNKRVEGDRFGIVEEW